MPSPAYGSSISPSSQSTGKSVPHYLHPDYLDPHSPSADPKLSPLALLAETCNNIGKDFLANKLDSPGDRKRPEKPVKVTATVAPAQKKSSAESKLSISAGSSPRSVCPDTSRQSPSSSLASPSSMVQQRRDRSRSPLPHKSVSSSTRRSPHPAEQAPPVSTTVSPSSLTSPASLLANSYLNYNPYAAALAPWSAALMASHQAHSSGTLCQDPYCPHCHVTHRPCACLQCLQHKFLTEPYNYLAGLTLPTPTAAAVSPPSPPSKTVGSGMTAEYCIYCGKHCPSTEDLLSHMQLHVKSESLPAAPQPFPLYPGLDLAQKIAASSPLSSGRPFHPFRPPMPSRLAAHLAYPFGAGLV